MASSSQGDKKPTLITKPPLTRPKDTPLSKQGNSGPKYGKN